MRQAALPSGTAQVQTVPAAASLAVSLVLGELFFKFGSFSLEVAAFLAAWAALYGLFAAAAKLLRCA